MRPKVFINTRFNIVLMGAKELMDKAGAPTRTPEWLERRFDLFERICLPSLRAQTHQDFQWLVFFSDDTPEPFLTRTKELHRAFPQFIPCFLEANTIQVRRFRAEVLKRIGSEDSHLITARIDNDDAFNRTYIERLRAEFRGQDDEIINFMNGMQYDADLGVAADLRKPSNPFIARIERLVDGKVRTVVDLTHDKAMHTGLVRDVSTLVPMWLQTIHSGNVLNRFASGRVRYSCDFEEEFGIRASMPIYRMRSFRVALSRSLLNSSARKLRNIEGG